MINPSEPTNLIMNNELTKSNQIALEWQKPMQTGFGQNKLFSLNYQIRYGLSDNPM